MSAKTGLGSLVVGREEAVTELQAQNRRLRFDLRDAKKRIRQLERVVAYLARGGVDEEAAVEAVMSEELGTCSEEVVMSETEVLACEEPNGHKGNHRHGEWIWGWVK